MLAITGPEKCYWPESFGICSVYTAGRTPNVWQMA